jgi:hypothetical protein
VKQQPLTAPALELVSGCAHAAPLSCLDGVSSGMRRLCFGCLSTPLLLLSKTASCAIHSEVCELRRDLGCFGLAALHLGRILTR